MMLFINIYIFYLFKKIMSKYIATLDDIKKIINNFNTNRCSNINYGIINNKINLDKSKNISRYDHKAIEYESCVIIPKNNINIDKYIDYSIKNINEIDIFIKNKSKKISSGGNGKVFLITDSKNQKLMIKKISKNNNFELYYEGMVGILLNELRKYIPNIVYTFGVFNNENETSLYQEYIEGKNFHNVLFNIDDNEIYSIFIQLANFINISYEKYGFYNLDLHDDNMIIKKLDEPISIPIYFKDGTIKYHITKILLYIIDYGRVRLVYDDKIYIYRSKNFKIKKHYHNNTDITKYDHDIQMSRIIKIIICDFFETYYDYVYIYNDTDIADIINKIKIDNNNFDAYVNVWILNYGNFDPYYFIYINIILYIYECLHDYHNNIENDDPLYGNFLEKNDYKNLMHYILKDRENIFFSKYFDLEKYFTEPFNKKKYEKFYDAIYNISFHFPTKYIKNISKNNVCYDFINKFYYYDYNNSLLSVCNNNCIDFKNYLILTVNNDNLVDILQNINEDNYLNFADKYGIVFPPKEKNKYMFFLNEILNYKNINSDNIITHINDLYNYSISELLNKFPITNWKNRNDLHKKIFKFYFNKKNDILI